MSAPYLHEADQHFVSLVDYLRHLVDVHGVEETAQLWRSGRDRFDRIHDHLHAEEARAGSQVTEKAEKC